MLIVLVFFTTSDYVRGNIQDAIIGTFMVVLWFVAKFIAIPRMRI
jgi:hypothetical protein